ncbi:hypothetical protein EDM22_07730 [Agromyces tardus]|jgi:hypothetical protein|uniref:Uncharacterized protein n=2 Tax=Agromyces tardus TaxID=2583849 RepID=A0A3M8AH21_9MICO|nr:hypothetical protein EDM22_07730 [Agromyces tardus]
MDFDAPDDFAGAAIDDVASASRETADELARIEAAPLGERSIGYDTLAGRLRAELERSDPSRDV